MKRLVLLSALLLASCATGTGEEATGLVESSLLPAGDASGGMRFDRALLGIDEIELIAAEEEEEPGDDGHDHGHGHAHLVRALASGVVEGAVIDLLGGEQPLGSTEAAVGSYEAALVELAPLTEGDGAGCVLFASGSAAIAEETVQVRLCLPAGAGPIEVPLGLELGLDQTLPLRLFFAVNGLLRQVPLADLERTDDGSLLIDAAHNAGTLPLLHDNLAAAFSVPAV